MDGIHFDIATLPADQREELADWVRGLIGDMVDHVRPYGRILRDADGRVRLHLAQVVHDHEGHPLLVEAREPRETAALPLVVTVPDGSWPAWLGKDPSDSPSGIA